MAGRKQSACGSCRCLARCLCWACALPWWWWLNWGRKQKIKLNVAGISLFVRPEEESHSKTKLSALSSLLAARFEQARDKPEYLEFCYELQVQPCKLGTGHLEPCHLSCWLVCAGWIIYCLFFVYKNELCLSLCGALQLSLGQGLTCFVGGLSALEVLRPCASVTPSPCPSLCM